MLGNRSWPASDDQLDAVVGVAPTLFCAPATWVASWMFGAASVLLIQDFELDAMLGLGIGRGARLGAGIERWLMRRFDAVSTISYSMVEHAAAKLGDDREVLFFPKRG